MSSTSIRDLLRLALPKGTRLKTNPAGERVHVQHVTSLRATHPAFISLGGGELVLVSVHDALALHEGMTQANLLRRLGEVGVAAMAVAGEIDAAAVTFADEAGTPLLKLPADTSLRAIERDAGYLLDNPRLQIERRASQLYSALTQQVAGGHGAEAVLRLLAEATGHPTAFYDFAGNLRAEYNVGQEPADLAERRPRPGREQHGDRTYLFKEVGGGEAKLGFVGICGASLDAWDDAAAEQAVASLQLELTKQQAVEAVEARVGGDLLQTILSGSPPDMLVLHSQAAELGYDLRRPHVALLIAPADGSTTPAAIREHLEHDLRLQQRKAPHIAREDSVLCMYPDGAGLEQPSRLLHGLARELPIAAGISTPSPTAAGWQRAYAEAEQALALGRHLFGPRSVTPFVDLRVYRLLFELRSSTSLWDFYKSVLGALVDYDRNHDGALLQTLEGYFAAQGNLSQAAKLLQIHRNTLLYRLRRIGEIAHVDLDHAEDALALQVALKAHRVLLAPVNNGR